MAYEIWSIAPGNLLATFDTKAEALAAVQAVLAEHGHEYSLDLALAYENCRGQTRTIAVGEALIQLAVPATQAPSPPARSAKAGSVEG